MYHYTAYNSKVRKWRLSWTPSWISQNAQWGQLVIIQILQ